LSIFTVYSRVVGPNPKDPIWAQSNSGYFQLEQALVDHGASPSAIVAVNNPAGYYIAAARRAIPIPDGDQQTLLAALRRYNARYVLLEVNHPSGLDGLYSHPEDHPGLHYLTTVEETRIFVVEKAFDNSF
jgi:hypothetical protein